MTSSFEITREALHMVVCREMQVGVRACIIEDSRGDGIGMSLLFSRPHLLHAFLLVTVCAGYLTKPGSADQTLRIRSRIVAGRAEAEKPLALIPREAGDHNAALMVPWIQEARHRPKQQLENMRT